MYSVFFPLRKSTQVLQLSVEKHTGAPRDTATSLSLSRYSISPEVRTCTCWRYRFREKSMSDSVRLISRTRNSRRSKQPSSARTWERPFSSRTLFFVVHRPNNHVSFLSVHFRSFAVFHVVSLFFVYGDSCVCGSGARAPMFAFVCALD